MSTNNVNIVIREDGSRVVKRNIEDIGKSAEKSGSLLEGMKGVLLGFAAFTGFREVVKATVEAEAAFAQLQAAVKSTGGIAGFTAEQLRDMSSELENTSTFADDTIQSMQSLLLSFKNIRGPEFVGAQQAIIDLATRMGGDLSGAALQVGKALDNPIQGLTMLRRAGVSFSASQQDVIKKLQESGDIVGAQQKVLEGLSQKFGGAAQAARDTFGGALSAVKNQLNNLMETNGGLPGATESLNELATTLKDPAVREGADQLFSILIKGAAAAASVIGKIVAGINVMFTGGADQVQKLDKQIQFLEDHRKTGVVTFGKNPYNDSTGVDFMGTKAIDAKIKQLKEEEDKLLGLGTAGIKSQLQEVQVTAKRLDDKKREVELTDEQIQTLQSLNDELTKQSGEAALVAKYGSDNARAMDEFHVKTELAKVSLTTITPELRKLLDQLASNRAAAAQTELTHSLNEQVGALKAQIAAGPLAAQALERYNAQLELTKAGAGQLTPALDALFTRLDRMQALKALQDTTQSINDQTSVLSLDVRNREIETQVINATRGLAVTKEETAALREKFKALSDLNEITQAQDQLLADSVKKRQDFTTQLTAIQNLLADPSTGFGKADATNALAGQNPELFQGTAELQQAQLAGFQTMYQQIDQMRQADLISEQTAQQMKANVAIQQNQNRLQNEDKFWGGLSSLSRSGNKQIAAIGKAAAVTQATIDGIAAVQKALASAPPPVNYALAAAVGVETAANIAGILGTGTAFATGGTFNVGGSGGTDSQVVAFRATPGEQVAVSTPQQVRHGPNSGQQGGAQVAPQVTVSPQIINVRDPSEIPTAIQSSEGTTAILNVISSNSTAIKQFLGG